MIQIPETITFFFSHRKDLLTFLLNSRSVQKIHLKLPWENENKNNKIIPSATGKFPFNPCNLKFTIFSDIFFVGWCWKKSPAYQKVNFGKLWGSLKDLLIMIWVMEILYRVSMGDDTRQIQWHLELVILKVYSKCCHCWWSLNV